MTKDFIIFEMMALLLSIDYSTTTITTTTTTTTAQTRRITTWPPTTTPPTTVRQGCLYNGQIFDYGETIESDTDYNCYGMYCDYGGGIVAWDAECFFYTPHCDGWTERIKGECCPFCHSTPTSPTTVPSSSTPTTVPSSSSPKTVPSSSTPTDGCVYKGKIYANGEYVEKDPNNCFGAQCDHGVVQRWEQACYSPPNVCIGVWKNITGQCCEVCVNETTTPQSTTLKTTTSIPQKCKIGNKLFIVGQRTNSDPCNVCTCTVNGTESCLNISCDETVLDCEVKYRPVGTCCYTCGSVKISVSLLLLLTLFLVTMESRTV